MLLTAVSLHPRGDPRALAHGDHGKGAEREVLASGVCSSTLAAGQPPAVPHCHCLATHRPWYGWKRLPVKRSESHSVASNSLQPYGPYNPWNSPGQNTRVGSCSLLQGIFPTQGSNRGLLHCRQILYQLSHQADTSRHCENVLLPALLGRKPAERSRTAAHSVLSPSQGHGQELSRYFLNTFGNSPPPLILTTAALAQIIHISPLK